jgi:hypothetical protein
MGNLMYLVDRINLKGNTLSKDSRHRGEYSLGHMYECNDNCDCTDCGPSDCICMDCNSDPD